MKSIPLNAESAKLIGRTVFKNGKLRLTHSASGCEFTFTGKKLILTVGCDKNCHDDGKRCNKPRVAVICGGRFIVKKVIEERCESFTIIDSEETVTKNIRIIKLSESAFSLAEVSPAETDDGASVAPVPEKPLKIEFIGDSITCGYGVDDSNMQSEFSCEAENAMKSYAYKTAEILDADYSIFSYSGYGIISGYTESGEKNTHEILPQWYSSYGFSYSTIDGAKLQDMPWDFTSSPPDIIVINLGTNDFSYCSKNENGFLELENEYVNFLRTIRSRNPNSAIVCTFGMMETETLNYISNAAKRLNDRNIFTFQFDKQDGLLGFGSNWHPSEDTQLYAAEKLAEFIKTII